MRNFPNFVDLEGWPGIVTGGGEKLAHMLGPPVNSIGQVTVFAAEACAHVLELSRVSRINLERRASHEIDIAVATPVFVAMKFWTMQPALSPRRARGLFRSMSSMLQSEAHSSCRTRQTDSF